MDSRSNTVARFKLLTKALQGAKNVPASLAKACRSQGAVAKYSCPSEGIQPMSLNTLKSSADLFIENGGWGKLEEMRKSYVAACKAGGRAAPSVRTKTDKLKDDMTELEEALVVERRYRIRLQVAYEALLLRMRGMAKSDPEIGHFINRHVEGFSIKRLVMADKGSDARCG